VIGQDRHRDRERRRELFMRKLSPEGRTRQEDAEFAQLDASFQEEDRDLNRRCELSLKEFQFKWTGGAPLTDAERNELAELDKRYPPDPNDTLAPFYEASRRAACRIRKGG
jgi:hypothetical protein